MYKLTHNLYLDHVDNINGRRDRVVVSRTADDVYLNSDIEELGKCYGIQELPKTLYYTKDVKGFIDTVFAERVTEWLNNPTPVVIYCDDDAYVRLFTLWITHVFPTYTPEDIHEWNFMCFLNREMSDRHFDWDHKTVSSKYVMSVAGTTPRSEALRKVITEYRETLHPLYLVVGFLAGDEGNIETTATVIREYLRQAIRENIRNIYRRVRMLFYTPHITSMLGVETTANIDKGHPLAAIGDLNLFSPELDLEAVFDDHDTLAVFRDDYKADMERLLYTVSKTTVIDNNVAETLTPVDLLLMEDDSELITRYIQTFQELDRFVLLIPYSEMGVTPFSLFMRAQQKVAQGESIPAPCWVT